MCARTASCEPASWDEAFAAIAAKLKAAGARTHRRHRRRSRRRRGDVRPQAADASLAPSNIDCRQDGAKLDPVLGRAAYLFDATIAGIEEADAILIIGANPRHEASVLNARIRKRWRGAVSRSALIGERPTSPTPTIISAPARDPGGWRQHPRRARAQRPLVIVGQARARPDGAATLRTAAARAGAPGGGSVRAAWLEEFRLPPGRQQARSEARARQLRVQFSPSRASIRPTSLLLIGTNPRLEAADLNARIRRALAPGRPDRRRHRRKGGPRLPRRVSRWGRTDAAGPGGRQGFVRSSAQSRQASDGDRRCWGGCPCRRESECLSPRPKLQPMPTAGKDASWNALNVLQSAASRVAGLDLGFVPKNSVLDIESFLAAAAHRQHGPLLSSRRRRDRPVAGSARRSSSTRAAMAMRLPIAPTSSSRARPIRKRARLTSIPRAGAAHGAGCIPAGRCQGRLDDHSRPVAAHRAYAALRQPAGAPSAPCTRRRRS